MLVDAVLTPSAVTSALLSAFDKFIVTKELSTGLNASGEGDLSNYYDTIEAERTKLLSAYETIYKLMQYHLFGKNLNITFEFKPLWQMSDLETAQLNKANAEVDNLYLNMGVVNEFDIKSRLVQDDRYPTITPESVEAERMLYEEMETLTNEETENNITA